MSESRFPKDASVTADGYIIPQICDYKELYLSPYNEEKTEYCLIDPMESSSMKTYENIQDEYTIIEVRARCVVLKRNDLIDNEEAKAVEEPNE